MSLYESVKVYTIGKYKKNGPLERADRTFVVIEKK